MERLRWPGPEEERLVDRARGLIVADRPAGQQRRVLGIAGAPAAGKSTLAPLLAEILSGEYPGAVTLVGMDAFHLAHRVLVGRGQVDIKGAPQTFDVYGYIALLRRLRNSPETVYAPEFDRGIEDSIAAAVEVGPSVRLVITEGNYLLLPDGPWSAVRPLLDEAWFVHLDDEERRRRMVARRLAHGESQATAEAKALGADEANARLVNAAPQNPDVWIEHTF